MFESYLLKTVKALKEELERLKSISVGEKGEKGEKGNRGRDGIDGKDGSNGLDGKDGLDGITPTKGIDYFDGKDGSNGLDGKDGITTIIHEIEELNPEDIRDSLESLKGADRLDAKAIKNLEQHIKQNVTFFAKSGAAGGSSGAIWGTITGTLSDQLDLQAELDSKQSQIDELNIITTNSNATSILTGGVLSTNVDPTKFDVSEITAYFVNNYTDPLVPTFSKVIIPASSANVVTNLASSDVTFLAIDIDGNLIQKTVDFTSEEQRDWVRLGALSHTTHTIIEQIETRPKSIGIDDTLQLSDMADAIGLLNQSGNVLSGKSGTLQIKKTSGRTFGIGINFNNTKKDPNYTSDIAQDPITFLYQYRDGSGDFTSVFPSTVLDPGHYDDGSGTLVLMNPNKWKNDRVFYIPTAELIVIVYGQQFYNSSADAIDGIRTEAPDINPPLLVNATFLCVITQKRGAVDSTDPSEVIFNLQSKFASGTVGTGGTTSTTSLQEAYNNSTTPEILTNSTLGAFTLKRGSASDTDNIFEGLNGADTITSFIRGDGTASFTALSVGNVSNTELQFLDGVTSAIQTQLNNKVTGAASATDNAIARFDLTTGKLIQNSGVTVDDQNAISHTVANTNTSSKTGISTTLTQSIASSGFYRGGLLQVEAGHSTGTVNTITGLDGVVRNTGAGTTTNANGFGMTLNPTAGTITNGSTMKSGITVGSASATITTARHFYATTPTNPGTIGTLIGLDIEDQSAAGGTLTNTPYGVRQQGASDRNWFAGKIGVGSGKQSPNVEVDVNGNVSVTDEAYGVSWNGSTNTPTKNAVYDKIETIVPFTDEAAQDAVGNILVDTNTINFTYNDGTPSIIADVRTQMSVTSDSNGVFLSGDEASPGNSQYYGTDSGGIKGFFSLPTSQIIDVQAYTTNSGSPFTWNRPAGATVVEVICIGAGGGGGGGSSIAAATLKTGGGGGGGGVYTRKIFRASELTGSVSVTVGAGGTGGTGGTNGNGNPGINGGDSSFGSYLIAYGGGGGAGGTSVGTRTGGSGGGTGGAGTQGAAATTTGGLPASTAGANAIAGQGAGATTGAAGSLAEYGGASGAGTTSAGVQGAGGSSIYGAAGGGAGGSYNANNANSRVPTVGGNVNSYVVGGGGTAGTNGGSPVAGGDGTNGDSTKCGSGGGGGGAGLAVTGTNGGNGGSHGGGGGGGGAASGIVNKAGDGGAGGVGAVYVISY